MCTKFKSCHFSITDIIDADEGVDVMLFCSYHDCLPEDTPADCDAVEKEAAAIDEYTDAMADHYLDAQDDGYDDVVPF